MTKLLWPVFFVVMLLSGCGWNGTPTRENDFTPLTSIRIVADYSTIAAHTSTKLKVIGNFSGLFTRDITSQAVWSSGSPTVAGFVTASSPSRVSGLIPGTAVLTATVGSISNTFTLTVSSATITSITVTPATPSVANGLSIQFMAMGTFSGNTKQDITFDATWRSSNAAVASVGDTESNRGFAQALTVGETTISATLDGVPGSTLLTVTEPVLQSITVTPANPSILTLSTTTFTATGNYSNGTTADITSLVTWASSDSGVATITSTSNKASTLTQGTTTISATLVNASGKPVTGTATLKVTGGNLTGITISPANSTLVKNNIVRITATGSFSNGAKRDITGAVEWSVTNGTVANVTVPVSGENLAWLSAMATSPASTAITAKSGSVTPGTANLAVTTPVLQSITISPTSLDLPAGTSNRFSVTAAFNDSTAQDVTVSAEWTSNAVAKATVGNIGLAKGRVIGVVAGSATISAVYGGLTVTAPVTVSTRTIKATNGLTISGTTTIVSGNQATFTAMASYTDGTTKDVTEDTTWSIDNKYVAILADSTNQPGQVVAVNTGTAILTAKFGGVTQTVTVTVP
jgi:hypothetical protein